MHMKKDTEIKHGAGKKRAKSIKKSVTMSGCKPKNLRTGGCSERRLECEDEKAD